MNNFNNFKIGDIVLFSSNPVYFPWHKGKIVANNAEIYYISEVDKNNNILDDRKLVTIDKDSKYIIKFKPGMEWCIGEKSDNIPGVNDYWESLSYDPYHQDDHAHDRNKTSETINVKKARKDSSEPSNEEYIEIPNVNEMFDNEKKWKRKIEKKLDYINDKLNKILLFQQTSKYPYNKNYPGTASSPWYEVNKIYCDNDINSKNSNTIPFDHNTEIYTSSIPLEDIHKYQSIYNETYNETKGN